MCKAVEIAKMCYSYSRCCNWCRFRARPRHHLLTGVDIFHMLFFLFSLS